MVYDVVSRKKAKKSTFEAIRGQMTSFGVTKLSTLNGPRNGHVTQHGRVTQKNDGNRSTIRMG